MFNVSLLWILLIPIFLSTLSVVLVPFLSKGEIGTKESLTFAGIGCVISAAIISIAFMIGKGAQTRDYEILNGQITSKSREHDSYTRSYSCMCVSSTNSQGQTTEVCQTCYEEHYTVTWSAASNIGGFRLKHLDETSDSVYRTADPSIYTNVIVGEPCSKVSSYTNYIKAVPNSLFRPSESTVHARFAGMIPTYPLGIYDEWKIDRVLPVKITVPNLREWNDKLSNVLKTLGPAKQANAIIILANTADSSYSYAVRDAWLNGKKNDIIVIIGATKFPARADWVTVLALTDDEMFKIKLSDDIMALETLSADGVIGAISANAMSKFKRKSMKHFAYLDAEIDPPRWVNISTVALTFIAYLSFWFAVYTNRLNSLRFGTSNTRRFR